MCSPQRPAGSSVSEAAQGSTGENLVIRPTDDEIIAQENLIRYSARVLLALLKV